VKVIDTAIVPDQKTISLVLECADYDLSVLLFLLLTAIGNHKISQQKTKRNSPVDGQIINVANFKWC
jgi:hypothetical protein